MRFHKFTAGFLLSVFFFFSLPVSSMAELLQEITIKDGETLWGIANVYLKDPTRWPEILKHNNMSLTDPTAALPGMKIKVPVLLIKEKLRKATLVYLLNDVRYRKRNQPKWLRASKKMDLYNEDVLRTMANSRAHIHFQSGDLLKLDEKSLVVLRPDLKIEEVNLLTGAMRASKVRLITPSAMVTPRTRSTIYKARVRNDKAVIVQVEKGRAEVFGLATGKKVMVRAGHANITMPKQPPSVPVKTPNLPGFEVPEFTDDGKIVKRKPAASAGKKLDVKKSYRIQFSQDRNFSNIALDEQIVDGSGRSLDDLSQFKLPDGTYYRRVSYMDESGKEGEFITLSTVVIDRRPPQLEISSPRDGSSSGGGFVNIEGKTEIGCFVTVNNYQVPIQTDGKFYWSVVLLKDGANDIVVVSKDITGNTTRKTLTVYKK